jgi:hypothetical protein
MLPAFIAALTSLITQFTLLIMATLTVAEKADRHIECRMEGKKRIGALI